MTQLVGVSATTRVAAGDKFRVTWQWKLAPALPSWAFNTVGASQQIREWLPSVGAIPVSSPSATEGDEVVVYDVRLAATEGGKTVAQVLTNLESLPLYMDVTRLEKLSLSLSSSQLEQGQAGAVGAGNEAANPWLDWLRALREAVGDVVALVVVAGVVIGAVYVYRETRK